MNYNDPGYLNPVMNNTVTDYQVFILFNSNHASGKEMIFFNFVLSFQQFQYWINLIHILFDLHWQALAYVFLQFQATLYVLFQQCLDSVGPFWSASDQSRVGLTEDMQVLFPSLYT